MMLIDRISPIFLLAGNAELEMTRLDRHGHKVAETRSVRRRRARLGTWGLLRQRGIRCWKRYQNHAETCRQKTPGHFSSFKWTLKSFTTLSRRLHKNDYRKGTRRH